MWRGGGEGPREDDGNRTGEHSGADDPARALPLARGAATSSADLERAPDTPSHIDPTLRAGLPVDGVTRPRTHMRQPVAMRDRVYLLRDSETQMLATVGTFRVVPAADAAPGSHAPDLWNGDIRNLAEQGLIERKQVVVNGQPTPVLVLTNEGKALLDAHQQSRAAGRRQEYHAGLVKPRELAHDAQLHRLYRAEAARIASQGGRVRRVVLDYELKRDYQKFLNRPDRSETATVDDDRRLFAAQAQLTVVDGRLKLPDLRIEYETPDGRLAWRDVELVTEHYSRGQISGKARAGFSMYRAAGSPGCGRSATAKGGTPVDPHHLEWLE